MTFNSFNRKFTAPITIISFCVPFFSLWSLDAYLAPWLIFYYEAMVGISPIFIVLGFGLTRFIVPFLQPILGYFSDRNYPATRTLGRRFLWIIIPGFLIPILFVLIFWAPTFDFMIFNIYFTTVFMLYNVSFSLYSTNYSALLLNKFRNPRERTLLAAGTNFIGTIGSVTIMIFAPIFISYASIQFVAIPIAITFAITLAIGIIGLIEEKGLIDTYFSPNQAPKENFFKDFFKRFAIFSRKNFLILLLRWMAFGLFNIFFPSSLVYYWEYVLEAPFFLINAAYLGFYIWMLIAIPVSFVLSWFFGHLKISIISGYGLGATLIALFLFPNILMTIILLSVIGFTVGLGMASLIPLEGDVFDDFALLKRKRSEGIGYGFLSMFGGLTVILSSFITAFVHNLTGFIAGWGGSQPASAVMGIRLLTTLIPAIVIIVAMIIFTVLYDLKPEKTEAIRMELKELEL